MTLKTASPFGYPKTGIYYLGKRVPSDLVPIVGKKEVKTSLRTKDPREAGQRRADELQKQERHWNWLGSRKMHRCDSFGHSHIFILDYPATPLPCPISNRPKKSSASGA